MCRFRAIAAPLLIMLWICLCLGCNDPEISVKNSTVEGTAIINLSAVTNSSQTEVFYEVRHASLLPSVVIDEFTFPWTLAHNEFVRITGFGEQFNTTDVVDLILPRIVAAVSEKYCIVSYWTTDISVSLNTEIFELSGGKVKRKWVSPGGGLNFRDLKNTMESGRILQFQLVPVRIAEKQSEGLLLTPVSPVTGEVPPSTQLLTFLGSENRGGRASTLELSKDHQKVTEVRAHYSPPIAALGF